MSHSFILWKRLHARLSNSLLQERSADVSRGKVGAALGHSARVGDKQCAFDWLEKGFEERDDLLIKLKVEPIFDGLHSDSQRALPDSLAKGSPGVIRS
jgi:hypothetical protein